MVAWQVAWHSRSDIARDSLQLMDRLLDQLVLLQLMWLLESLQLVQEGRVLQVQLAQLVGQPPGLVISRLVGDLDVGRAAPTLDLHVGSPVG